MREELPFSTENRPWLTADCIEAMNEAFMDIMSKIPPEYREALREWAAVRVEMRECIDKPDMLERCSEWGERWMAEQALKNSPPLGQ